MTGKARKAKEKAEGETVERERTWAKEKANDKAEIARVNSEDRDRSKAKAEARVREKIDAFQRAAEETNGKIRAKADAKR